MIRSLYEICNGFKETELENLSRAHLGDAIKVLEEASRTYENETDARQTWQL